MQLFRDGLFEAIRLILSRDPQVMDATWRSLWISLLSTLLAAGFGIGVGSVLARKSFWGRSLCVLVFRAGMAVPTVFIGLMGYGLLSRRGFFGGLELLYTPWAIVLGEFCLAVPIIVTWTHETLSQLDPRLPETVRNLGAGPTRRWWIYLTESRNDLLLAILTAFARCFTELGIAMMLGGNIKYQTRTLTTATALETARGEFARGIAMGMILFAMAMGITIGLSWISRPKEAT